MARAPKPVSPECPRCGYDVSGVMATWANECPLEGKCSECGYDFQWKHLLGPNLGVPKWFFETARRRLIRSAISTSVRTLVPWKFWRQVPLHAPVNSGRLRVLVVAAPIWAYVLGVVCMCVCGFVLALKGGGVYGFASYTSWNRKTGAGRSWATPAKSLPDRMNLFVHNDLAPALKWPASSIDTDLHSPLGRVVLWLLLVSMVMPLCFRAVSGTLRTENVRFAQLIRASVYAWTATAVSVCMWFMLVFAASIPPILDGYSVSSLFVWGVDGAKVLLCWPLAMVGWWWCMCRFYLRIRHAFWVALLLQVMAVLGTILLLFPIIDPSTWIWLLGI